MVSSYLGWLGEAQLVPFLSLSVNLLHYARIFRREIAEKSYMEDGIRTSQARRWIQMVSGCLTLIWQLGLRFGSQEEVDITQGLEADFSLQGFASGQFTCIYMYAKRISHLQEIGEIERTGWSVIVLECHRILSYIYLRYWCPSSALSSLVAEHCCAVCFLF